MAKKCVMTSSHGIRDAFGVLHQCPCLDGQRILQTPEPRESKRHPLCVLMRLALHSEWIFVESLSISFSSLFHFPFCLDQERTPSFPTLLGLLCLSALPSQPSKILLRACVPVAEPYASQVLFGLSPVLRKPVSLFLPICISVPLCGTEVVSRNLSVLFGQLSIPYLCPVVLNSLKSLFQKRMDFAGYPVYLLYIL